MIESYVTRRKTAPPKYNSENVDRLFRALQKKGLGDGPNTVATVMYYFGKKALLTEPDKSTAKTLERLSSHQDHGEVAPAPVDDGRPFRGFPPAEISKIKAGSLWGNRKGPNGIKTGELPEIQLERTVRKHEKLFAGPDFLMDGWVGKIPKAESFLH